MSTALTFLGWENGSFAPGPSLTVLMAGQSVPLSESPSGQAGVSLFSADVNQWAGQVVELEFVARIPPAGFPADGVWKGAALIDSIMFVPEPTSFTLLGFGWLALSFLRGRK